MAKKLIVANWKMNPKSLSEARKLFALIKKSASGLKKVNTVLCPPFVYLPSLGGSTSKKGVGIHFGAQDIFWTEKKTSFTGEISASMLKDNGVKYVIVGHSERRRNFGETNDIVNRKVIEKSIALKQKESGPKN